MFGSGKTRRYAEDVESALSALLGSEKAKRIAKSSGGRDIISAYHSDGISPEKAARYVAAKIIGEPKNAKEESIQRELAAEFQKHNVDFWMIDPELHYAILADAIELKLSPIESVETFFVMVEMMGEDDETDEQRTARLLETYADRIDRTP